MKSPLKSLAALARLSDEQVELLARRLKATRILASKSQRSRSDVELAAEEIGVHVSTLYRDIRRLKGRGAIEDLAPRNQGWPEGRSKLHGRQEELISEFLRSKYLVRARPAMVSVVEAIGNACEAEGYSRPSRATVIRRCQQIPQREIVAKRQGPKAAEQHTPRPGRYDVKRPWDVWQIDHTLADVIVVDRHGRPIGRPWLTVVIDVCTRVVPAFYIGLEAPSSIRVATTLDLAVSPKGPWLKQHGYDYDHPIEGLPKLLHSDHGSDFTTPVLVRAMKNEGSDTVLRPPGRVRFGGHVERLIGTLMGTCRLLPGATHNSPAARGNYDSKASARLTLDHLEDYFAHQILGRYHNQEHSALGLSPLEAWRTVTAGMVPEHPHDPETFRLNLLPELQRTIGRQGIKAFNDYYYSQEVGEAFIRGIRNITVKYDPRNLSKVYVHIPPHGYVTVPQRLFREGPPTTLWLYKASRQAAGEMDKTRSDPVTVRRATAAAEKVVTAAAPKSVKAARQLERLHREREMSAHWPRGAHQVVEASDDDWGGAFGGGE